MTLEQQVCSLELAKRLKELGTKQWSLFWWTKKSMMGTDEEDDAICENPNYFDWFLNNEKIGLDDEDNISAFTVAELGEMLPVYFSSEKHTKEWRAGIVKQGVPNEMGAGLTEADARAKMLIYLIENKLIPI